MPCIDTTRIDRLPPWRAAAGLGLWSLLALMAGCQHAGAPAPSPAPPAAVPNTPAPPLAGAGAGAGAAAPTPAPPTGAATARPTARSPRYVKLAPPSTPRNAAELRLQFARRLVAAHPDTSYTERAPDRLWAIPVLEVELNADGSVRRIEVLRKPTTGNEATQLAIEAVHRAAPYGEVSRLPRPWKVVETFLFDDALRFKPRTLD